MTNNADRANMAFMGANTMKDEVSEAIIMESVSHSTNKDPLPLDLSVPMSLSLSV
jgi:hypothetical protein